MQTTAKHIYFLFSPFYYHKTKGGLETVFTRLTQWGWSHLKINLHWVAEAQVCEGLD
jgi:hypothetical protein